MSKGISILFFGGMVFLASCGKVEKQPESVPVTGFYASEPTQAQIDYARTKLVGWLGSARGAKAVTKVMNHVDGNRSGWISRSELIGFLSTIGVGNGFTRGYWADGILSKFGRDGFMNRDGVARLLKRANLWN